MPGPQEQFCDFCGEPCGVFSWSRSTDGPISCGKPECEREIRDMDRAQEEEARLGAEEDGFSRYGGPGRW